MFEGWTTRGESKGETKVLSQPVHCGTILKFSIVTRDISKSDREVSSYFLK